MQIQGTPNVSNLRKHHMVANSRSDINNQKSRSPLASLYNVTAYLYKMPRVRASQRVYRFHVQYQGSIKVHIFLFVFVQCLYLYLYSTCTCICTCTVRCAQCAKASTPPCAAFGAGWRGHQGQLLATDCATPDFSYIFGICFGIWYFFNIFI